MIVDAHAHVYRGAPGRADHPAESLLAVMDEAGVDRAVLLQGPFYGDQNDYVAEVCRRHADRLCGLAFLDPWAPGARSRFEDLAAREAFRGLKLECSVPTGLLRTHPGARLDDAALSWLWPALEELAWVLVLDLGRPGTPSYQTEAVRGIARARPRLRIVIAHLGQPGPWLDAEPGNADLWGRQLELAALPNVWFDTAALPAYRPEESWPWPGAASDLRRGLAAVGPRRLLWGTDAPGLLSRGSYPRLRAWVEEATAGLAAQERGALFGGNAREVFSLS